MDGSDRHHFLAWMLFSEMCGYGVLVHHALNFGNSLVLSLVKGEVNKKVLMPNLILLNWSYPRLIVSCRLSIK